MKIDQIMKEADLSKDEHLIVREEVKNILTCRGKSRIKKILDSPNPASLIAQIPPIEIFLTIKEVGEQDAIELIGLTTPEQLTFLLDLDLWHKDQIAPDRFLSWLEILEQCGENKLQQFFRTTDLELLASSFRKLIRVIVAINPDEVADEYREVPLFSFDQIYFFEFLDERASPLLIRLLHFLFESMPDFYHGLLKRILWSIPAEEEELALRWRNGRLADLGFPNFNEAQEIYSYFPPEKIKKITFFALPKQEEAFYPPTYLELVSKGTFFSTALQQPLSEETQDRVKWELTGLINRVLIADGGHLGDIEALYRSAQKAMQTLDLGLKYLSKGNAAEARLLLEKIPVTRIFQAGFSLGLNLKKKAQRIVHKGWLANLPRKEEILDSPLKETIKGLLRKRPLFFDEETGNFVLFTEISEISLVEDRIEKISILGEIIHGLMGISKEEIISIEKSHCFFPDPPLSTICLTYLSQNLLYGVKKLAPLSESELQKVYEKLRLNGFLNGPGKNLELAKQLLIPEIITEEKKLEKRIEKTLLWWFDFLQNKLYSSLGHIRAGEKVDPRAVDVFLISFPD